MIRQKYVAIKHFGKLFNLFLFRKRKITNKIALVDEDETVKSGVQLISEELNQFFRNTTKALNVRENSCLIDKHFFWYWKRVKKSQKKKASTFGNMPPKISRASKERGYETLAEVFNNNLLISSFPHELKVAHVTPIFKKGWPIKNYRPVSVLPVVSKIFERLLHKQMSLYVDRFLSPYLCGYWKDFSTKQVLISLLEKWKSY